jgi:hypothetical protein
MRLAIIENNIIKNIIISDLSFAEKMKWEFVEIKSNDPYSVGWTYDGVNFIAPVEPLVDETISE